MLSRLASRALRPHAVAAGLTASAAAGAGAALCNDDCIPSLSYGWPQDGALSSFDHAAIRRGFQVYRQVCSSCHSIQYISFRNFVGVTHDEAGAKKLAEEFEVTDAQPNDDGEMFERPAKLFDRYPGPYRNEAEGRAANGGALPPDLSLMTKARHGGIDYVFALLTGYADSPAGKDLLPGLYYNPYFAGGAIAMPPPLMDGQVEYEDGTPATVTQMAKDVSQFLAWCAEPEHDERKKFGVKAVTVLALGIGITAYYKRLRWAPVKTRKITYME
ncbi:cytochrome c1 [Tribonema minus]|uniref:Cytochrome c1 n=1 Tax=Tribonema minus TaxID=303371 RepID=A0A835Z587_9STRA|nr:cytochrome c1 [Tribonema minus]